MGSSDQDVGQLDAQLISAAIEADGKGRYFEARRLYTVGLEKLELALKDERNERSRELIERKYKEYSERLDIVKNGIEERRLEGNDMIPGPSDSPNIVRLIENGLEAIERALGHDEKGQLSEALKYYREGLDHLVMAMRWCKNADTKMGLRTRIEKYLENAERVKAQMEAEELTRYADPPPEDPPEAENTLPATSLADPTALTMQDLEAPTLSGSSGPST